MRIKSRTFREELLEPTPENEAGKQRPLSIHYPFSEILWGFLLGIPIRAVLCFLQWIMPQSLAITAPFQLIVSYVAICYPLNEKHNFPAQPPTQGPGRPRNPEDQQMQVCKTAVCSELKLHREGM